MTQEELNLLRQFRALPVDKQNRCMSLLFRLPACRRLAPQDQTRAHEVMFGMAAGAIDWDLGAAYLASLGLPAREPSRGDG